MPENYRVAAQLVASRVVLISTELVSYLLNELSGSVKVWEFLDGMSEY
jgi:hypothetical protein